MSDRNEDENNSRLQSFTKILDSLRLNLDSSSQPKSLEDYKFWKTQPVVDFNEKVESMGPVNADNDVAKVRQSPYPILDEFEWVIMDIQNPEELDQIYNLLKDHYVEDVDSTIRFKYSKSLLKWALMAPKWRKEWHIGVRVKSSKQLIAFISGIPMDVMVRQTKLQCPSINFLCVHRKLRSKRLAPLLIKEITRRINLENIWQALYSSGTILPRPIATCRIHHRCINWEKLYKVEFSYLPNDSTVEEQVELHQIKLQEPSLPNLREMQPKDIEQVKSLLEQYLTKFDMHPAFSDDDMSHWFIHNDRDSEKVVWAYVVEDENHQITDFFSFYSLPSTLVQNQSYDSIEIAYLFYYATDANEEHLKDRVSELMHNCLLQIKKLNFDVLNALTVLDNHLFLEDLGFEPGNGLLNYYLYNWKMAPLASGTGEDGTIDKNGSKVGMVML